MADARRRLEQMDPDDYDDNAEYYEDVDAIQGEIDFFDDLAEQLLVQYNFSPNMGVISSRGDNESMWKLGNLWQVHGSLDTIKPFMEGHINHEAADRMLPADINMEYLIELAGAATEPSKHDGLRRWEAPLLTPWEDVARVHQLISVLNIPGRKEIPGFKASRAMIDFDAEFVQRAIRTAVIQEQLGINYDDEITNHAIGEVVRFMDLDQRVGLEENAIGAYQLKIGALQGSIQDYQTELNNLEDATDDDSVTRKRALRGLIKDQEETIDNYRRIVANMPIAARRIEKLNKPRTDQIVEEKTVDLKAKQEVGLQSAIEYEEVVNRAIAQGLPIPQVHQDHVWSEDMDNPAVWQREAFSRRMFRHVARRQIPGEPEIYYLERQNDGTNIKILEEKEDVVPVTETDEA